MEEIFALLDINHKKDTISFFDDLNRFFAHRCSKTIDVTNLELVDKKFFEQIKSLPENVSLCFGKNLQDLKCTIVDDDNLRHHDIYLKYNGIRKLSIAGVNLPYSQLQECEYTSIEEIISAFQNYINTLRAYFHELECIDQMFTVMEPVKPTYKDDYRRILLDERTWLHIEVTKDGSANNIHLVGQSEQWHDKLQAALKTWDHDKNVVENIMAIFDIMKTSPKAKQIISEECNEKENEVSSCAICFCVELPDNPGVPQPLCQNLNCGVYYHNNCLFQWLVACDGGRLPAFGVANGSCPTCLQPISCNEKDD